MAAGIGLSVGVAILALIATAPAAQASPHAARGPALRAVADVVALLPAVTPIRTGYTRASFAVPPVERQDADDCAKRERVLIESAEVRPTIREGCTLVGGSWLVDNGTRRVNGQREIDVVPLVSGRSAWGQGAFGWSNGQRRELLRWQQRPARECALGGGGRSGPKCGYVLQSRGSGGLTAQITDLMGEPGWQPTCPQVAGITTILATWGLSVDPDVKARMLASATTCRGDAPRIHRRNTINPIPPTETGSPYLADGTSDRVWRTTEVLDATAGPVVPADLFGLHVPEPLGPTPQVEFGWLRLWDAKTGWEPLEQNQGIFYWKSLDESLALAEATGARVLYVFGDTPPWAGPSATMPPTDIAAFQRYAEAVINRYGSRIDAFEVWNEPNLLTAQADDVADLVDMTTIVHDAVRSAGLSSLVLTPSTTMRTGTAAYPFFEKYLSRLAARGWPIDGYSFHTYPRAAGGPAARVAAIAQFKEMLVLAAAPIRPIVDSEINYGLGGLDEPRRAISGGEAQGYLAQTFIDGVRFGLSSIHWYLWFPGHYDLLGIQLSPGTTHTIDAWRWTHDQLVGASLTACAQEGDATICGFTRAGTRYALAYSSTGRATTLAVPDGLSRACDMDATCAPITGGAVTVGIRPVRLE